VRKRRPPQRAQLGYSPRTPNGMGNRTGPGRAHDSGKYTLRRTQRPAVSPPPVPHAAGTHTPPPCRGRSDSFTAAAAPWVPRVFPCPPPGPPARSCHCGPLATVRAAGSLTPLRARVSGVSSSTFAGAGQGVTPSRPFARHYATR